MRIVASILVALVLVMVNMDVALNDTGIDVSVQEALAACLGCSSCFGWQGSCEDENYSHYCGMIIPAGCSTCFPTYCYRQCFDGPCGGSGGGGEGGEHPE